MRPKDCAYIVEHLSVRFMAMVADHSRQLAEHRAAFGARTEADRKIIAGLRSEIGAARMAVLERDSLISERAKLQSIINERSASAKEAGEKLGWTGNESAIQAVERVVKERDGLLTQVQDMRAEIKQRAKEQDQDYKTIVSLMSEREGLRVQVQDMREEIIRVNDAHGQTLVECDALRAKVDLLTTLRPKYKVGDKLESYSSAVTIVGVRTVYDCQADGAEYPVGHSEDELTERYEQTPPEATHAEPDLTQLHAKGKEAWSDVPNATQWVEEMRGNSEATHDTEAGKAAAESAAQHSAGIDIGTWSRKVTT